MPINKIHASITTDFTNEEEPKKKGRGRLPKLDRTILGCLEASPVKKKVAEGIWKSTRTKNNFHEQINEYWVDKVF